jgi:hypothetical protein
MPLHPRIETPEFATLVTTRTRNSELWFVNNPELEERVYAYLAKYACIYEVIVYGFILMGNHYHLLAQFPKGNRAAFTKAFNSIVARLTPHYVGTYPGGSLWGRRYSSEVVPENGDIEDEFFYLVLQAVKSGLAPRISQYRNDNCFTDAVHGTARKYRLVDWSKYKSRKRFNKSLTPADFTTEYTLTFRRIPGYEELSQRQYAKRMHRELETRRAALVQKRRAEDLGFADPERLQEIKPGARPKTSKTSARFDLRPRVLTKSLEAKQAFLEFYFGCLAAFRDASLRYRQGNSNVDFPPGMYKPSVPVPLT